MNSMGHYKHMKKSIRRSKGSLSNSSRCNSRISMKTKAMTKTNVDEVETVVVDKVKIPTTSREGKAQHKIVKDSI